VIDGDPGQTRRIAASLRDHPDYGLVRDTRHHCRRLTDGEQKSSRARGMSCTACSTR
jgi:hypothetical protein